jgi:hypothetical protein
MLREKAGRGEHVWFVFEARNRRLAKPLSDLNGTDAYIHDGRVSGVFRKLCKCVSEARPTAFRSADEDDISGVKEEGSGDSEARRNAIGLSGKGVQRDLRCCLLSSLLVAQNRPFGEACCEYLS